MKNIDMTNVITALLIGITVAISTGLGSGIQIGSMAGLIVGALYIIFIHPMHKVIGKKFETNKVLVRTQVEDGKKVIIDCPANHFRGIESVGGWLFLLEEGLYFKSHSMNFQNHELIIPLNQIKEVKATLTLGLIPNGLKIITVDNVHERFVLYKNQIWVEQILEAKRLAKLKNIQGGVF